MKKLLFFAAAATMFAACSKDTTHDLAIDRPIDKLYVSIGDDDSRVQLNNECKTVWNEGDRVSVFNKTTENECWQFDGKTGDRSGTISKVSGGTSGIASGKTIAVYPYDETNTVSTDGIVTTTIPDVQTYCADSYGVGNNIMVASSENGNLVFKNALGWIKIQLIGTETVKFIELKGNSKETLAGKATIDDKSLEVSIVSYVNTILTLDCGEGITLSAEPTSFYFAVPPHDFKYGLTVIVHYADGSIFMESTDKSIRIERNHITQMKKLWTTETAIPNNQIWYTSMDGEIVEPNAPDFGANIVSNIYEYGKGIITFDGDVKRIGYKAFMNRTSLTSITIPNSVTAIEDNAFQDCARLTKINIPNGVTVIGHYAFRNCRALKSITIPNSVTSIRNFTFDECSSLISITIPDSVTSIGENAFCRCSNLTNINIPNGVTKIGDWAFSYCSSLKTVTIGNGVTSIGRCAFQECNSLTNIIIGRSVTSIGDSAFYKCSRLTNVNIPDGVNKIESLTFYWCWDLTSITIPDSVTEIGDHAFYGCSSMTSITIGNSVTSIGDWAFYDCNNLNAVYITDIAKWCAIKFNVYSTNPLKYAHNLYLNGELVTDLVIPDGVTAIGDYAFYRCSNLTSVTIPNSVTSIGDYAFFDCDSMINITIPDSVTTIGSDALSCCSNLTSITIPDSVTSIGDDAISGCSRLTDVTIGHRVKSIGKRAFSSCSKLENVYCKPTTPPTLGIDAFKGITYIPQICVPKESVQRYKSHVDWLEYKFNIVGYNF